MTLENRLLERLANWRPEGRASQTVDHVESGWRVTVEASRVDTLGAEVHSVRVARLEPLAAPASPREWAEAAAKRVSGLLEPLRLVEADEALGVAQLRSDAPAVHGESRAYYELLRHRDGRSELARYQSSPEGRRQAIPFTLTHEALGKLARDLAW